MRMLLLLRGLPGSGKSYWVYKNHLQDYTISSDNLRTMMGSNLLDLNGKYGINNEVNPAMWGKLFEILESRFSLGAFTVLDSTNIKTADMQKIHKVAKKYRYRTYCVDFTDVPFDKCMKRNLSRDENKVVHKSAMERMYIRLQNSAVPGGIKVIKPEDWLIETRYRTEDISEYKRVHHIGDIHGCNSCLQSYLKDGIKNDEFYIFIGDYIDRGIENVETVRFIASIADKPNVVLLEGNHDKYLWSYYNNEPTKSPEFEEVTRKQFDSDELLSSETVKKYCYEIARKLRQCFIYKWNNKIVFCNHGGISKLPSNVSLINTEQLIKGVGVYRDMMAVDDAFAEQNWDREVYQVHGHRNIEQVPIQVNNRCFNLCEHIEYGGNLRSLILDENGFTPILTKNPVYKRNPEKAFNNVPEMIEAMGDSPHIKVVPQGNSNISSYNFTRDAFSGGIWNDMTSKARGLFINTKTQQIVARGYDKFFNINERPETNLDVLPNTISYPVVAYKKENGFLGLLGFDKESDRLLYCSKSEINGKYAKYFKKILLDTVDESILYNYMKSRNVTMLFEVIDIKNDPHIIKYQKSRVILLDIVENNINFKHYSYDKVVETAKSLGIEYKECCYILNSPEEFKGCISEISKDDYKWKNRYIEGFVFVDKYDFMFKYKCEYYKYWKFLRGQVESMTRGRKPRVDNPFLKWVGEDDNRVSKDIITLRTEFLERRKS